MTDPAGSRLAARIKIPPRYQGFADIVLRTIHAQSVARLSLAAAGVAFWIVIAIFPATIAVITVFGLFVDPKDISDAVTRITEQSPNSVGAALANQAAQAAQADTSALSIGLIVSLAVTLWSVSDAAYGMARALREAYSLPPQSYVRARLRAFIAGAVGVVALGLLYLACAALMVWLPSLGTWWRVLAIAVAIPVGLVIQAGILLVLVRFAISGRTPWRSVVPGATLASVAIALLIVGLAIYASFAPSYQAVYGALTGIILTMLAGYFGTYTFLLCATFNAQWVPLPESSEATGRSW